MPSKRAMSSREPPADATGPQSSKAAELLATLDAYMVRQGLRSTEQRRVIVDTFVASQSHLTIEELLALVKKRDPRIGYATVYRTLKMLAESGIANELHFGDGFSRYELREALSHHDHLICTSCGKIVEFEEPGIEELQVKVAEMHGFVITSHRHEMYGLCPECQANVPEEAPTKR
ncbi:MAG TPA: transcriptional repressor [Polyangiaceae bacterium]|nr:transcriptional repressor [Polyangiaceae bacterium]